MTLVRCRDHIIIKGDIHNYAAYATPLGFPDESLLYAEENIVLIQDLYF